MAGKQSNEPLQVVNVQDLVTAEDIAARLKVSAPAASKWARTDDQFPKPIKTAGRVLIFDWAKVEAWARATGRLDEHGQPARPSTDPTRRKKARSD